MSARTHIVLEPAKQLTVAQDEAIVRAAFERNDTPLLRLRLARILFQQDAFDDVIAVLEGAPDRDSAGEEILAQAYLARETPTDDLRALAAAERSVALAEGPARLAGALALRGKAETRLGRRGQARATLAEALAIDPSNKDACKRLVTLSLEARDPDGAIALVDRLAAQGADHSRLFAARVLAHARRGDVAAATACGGGAFVGAGKLAPPDGWADIETFNRALAEELVAHPGLRFERYGSASELTWRIDTPLMRDTPLVRLLLERIAAEIGARIAGFPDRPDPWLRARPAAAVLRNWCVITESVGYETWHVHQFGWLSGSYYVRVPDAVAGGTTEAGCIALGLPEDIVGDAAAAAFGIRMVRPQGGLLLTFPSHTYHRTFPHGSGERRICVAFDVRPH